MYEELRCTKCRSKLKKINNNLICSNDGISYEIKNDIPIMWKTEFDNNREVKERISKELAFSKDFVTKIKEKLGSSISVAGLGAEEFYLRHTGETYAAKNIDQRTFDALDKMLPDMSGTKVLNVGCGGGKDAEWLIGRGVESIVCADISVDLMELAKEKLNKQKIKPKYYFQANAELLPVADDSFDAIFFGSVLHHILRPFIALKEAARIAPLIIACSEPSDMHIFKYILKWTGWSTEYGGLKTHRFNINKLKKYMSELGYETTVKTEFTWFPLNLLKRFSNNKTFVDTYYVLLTLIGLFFGYFGHSFNMVSMRRKIKP